MAQIPRKMLTCLAALALAAPAMAADAPAPVPQRDRLEVVSSGSLAGLVALLGRAFAEHHPGVNQPTIRPVGSTRALEQFCAGVGRQTPDIAISSRRMPRAVADACRTNGVTEVVEQELGLGAVVIAVRRGDPTPSLTSRQVWEALAAERPVSEEGDGFVANRAATWADVDPALPRSEIRMLVPNDDAGMRALFDELVMENGCRYVKAIRLVFEAAYRYSKCIALRRDGRVREMASNDIGSALLASPPGTMAIMSYDQVLASGGSFLALTLDGVLPTPASIATQDYEQTQTIYLYAKLQNGLNRRGSGVVRGIPELLAEAATEDAIGPGGYLTLAGLVSQVPSVRNAQRQVAARLTLMSR